MTTDRRQYMKDYRSKQKDKPAEGQAQRIAVQIEQSYLKHKKLLEDGLKTTMPGSNAYLKYTEALDDLERKHREELADRGLTPRQLGVAVKSGWHFVCHVARGGAVTCTEVLADKLEDALRKRAEEDATRLPKETAGDKQFVDELNREYGFDEDGNDRSYDDVNREKDDDDDSK
jgi:hypothetical protein